MSETRIIFSTFERKSIAIVPCECFDGTFHESQIHGKESTFKCPHCTQELKRDAKSESQSMAPNTGEAEIEIRSGRNNELRDMQRDVRLEFRTPTQETLYQ